MTENIESVPARLSKDSLRRSNVLIKEEVLNFEIPPERTEVDQECHSCLYKWGDTIPAPNCIIDVFINGVIQFQPQIVS